jgi:hypothetical protein
MAAPLPQAGPESDRASARSFDQAYRTFEAAARGPVFRPSFAIADEKTRLYQFVV